VQVQHGTPDDGNSPLQHGTPRRGITYNNTTHHKRLTTANTHTHCDFDSTGPTTGPICNTSNIDRTGFPPANGQTNVTLKPKTNKPTLQERLQNKPTEVNKGEKRGNRYAKFPAGIVREREKLRDQLDQRIIADSIDEAIAQIEKAMAHPHLNTIDDIVTSTEGLEPEVCDKITPEGIAKMVRGAPEPTFKPKEMLRLLSGLNFNNRKLLEQLALAELEGGFRLDNDIEYRSVTVKNGASAYQHASMVHGEVGSSVDDGFILGPFDREEIPFEHLRISGIFVIKRKEHGRYRLIFNLSAPEGDSINDGRTLKIQIKYDTFKVAARRLAELRRAMAKRTLLLGKEDIKSFYNRLAIRPHDWWQFAFQWFDVRKPLPKQPYKNRDKQKIYMYRVAPFGAVASVEIAHQISRAILFLYLHPSTSTIRIPSDQFTGAVYVDDFLIAVTAEWADAARRRLRALLISMGLPLSDAPTKIEESRMSSTKLYVGIRFDIKAMTVSVDPEKRARAVVQIDAALGSHFLSRKKYRSLVGTLNYLALCVRNGKTFMRALWNGLRYQGHKRTITLDNSIKKDLRWWRHVAPKWNGVALIQPASPKTHPEMRISTDSTLKGYCMVNAEGVLHGKPRCRRVLRREVSTMGRSAQN